MCDDRPPPLSASAVWTTAAVWATAAGLWTFLPAAYCGGVAGERLGAADGWVVFGLTVGIAVLMGGWTARDRYGGPSAERPGGGTFGTYETLVASAAFFWGLAPAAVAGSWAASNTTSPPLGWAAFFISLVGGCLAAWQFARRTRDRRTLHGWLAAVGPAVLTAFAVAAVWWALTGDAAADAAYEDAMANRRRHWFPPVDAWYRFTAGLGGAIAAAITAIIYGLIMLACLAAALGGVLLSLAGVWGRWVLNRGAGEPPGDDR